MLKSTLIISISNFRKSKSRTESCDLINSTPFFQHPDGKPSKRMTYSKKYYFNLDESTVDIHGKTRRVDNKSLFS